MKDQLYAFALALLAATPVMAVMARVYTDSGASGCTGNYYQCNSIKSDTCCETYPFEIWSAAFLGVPGNAEERTFQDSSSTKCYNTIKVFANYGKTAVCVANHGKGFQGAAWYAHKSKRGVGEDCKGSQRADMAYLTASGGHSYNITDMSEDTRLAFGKAFADAKSVTDLASFAQYEVPNAHDAHLEIA